jgi:hypothetical protein
MLLSSDAPVRLTWLAGAGLAVVGVAATVAAAWPGASPASERSGASLAAIVAVASLVAAVQTAAVAIVGEYVVRTYRECQGRPGWVVRRTTHATDRGGQASVDVPSRAA